MTRRLELFAALAIALGTMLFSAPAHAQQAQNSTRLVILNQDPLQTSSDLVVQARLTTDAGAPIPNELVELFLSVDFKRTVATDSNGVATFNLHFNLPAGNYNLVFSFRGNVANRPTSLTVPLLIGGTNSTRITIEPLSDIPSGRSAIITVKLTTEAGVPVVNEHLELFVDGLKTGSGDTDMNGTALLGTGGDISTGPHRLLVTYAGSRDHAPASASVNLDVNALMIEIHTVPVLEGVKFVADNREFITGEDGVARLPVNSPGTYHVEVKPFESTSGDVRAEFFGWSDREPGNVHEVSLPTSSPLLASFKVSYRVRQTFVDLSGNAVDPSRVTSVTYKRSDGAMITFADHEPHWLESNYMVRRLSGPVSNPFLYSLMSVLVNGTNVVSAQQQRFEVHPNDHWVLQLLLFSAHFQAHDTLFGWPLGSSILLEYPDGYKVNPKLDDKSQTTVVSLPRGNYTVTVKTDMGFSTTSPLAMSRNQVVDLPIVSYIDLLALALIGLVVGPGVLLVGQPRLRKFLLGLPRSLRAGRRPVAQA